MEEVRSVSKESMFLWSDIQSYRGKTEVPSQEVLKSFKDEQLAEEILRNYLQDVAKSRVDISEQNLAQVLEVMGKGPPYPKDLFDNIADDIQKWTIGLPFLKGLKSFAFAAIYRCYVLFLAHSASENALEIRFPGSQV